MTPEERSRAKFPSEWETTPDPTDLGEFFAEVDAQMPVGVTCFFLPVEDLPHGRRRALNALLWAGLGAFIGSLLTLMAVSL